MNLLNPRLVFALCAAVLSIWTPLVNGSIISYTYDGAGRLTKVDYGGGKTISYLYDNAGNLLQASSAAPPVLPAQPSIAATDLSTLVVSNTATDSSFPARTLTYVLSQAPTGATIDTNGTITWTPLLSQSPSTNIFTTVAIDNGVPPLSATNSFTITVSGPYDGIDLTDPVQALADPDGDGVPNLMEFALGTDPRNPSDASGGLTTSTVQHVGGHYVSMQFKRRKNLGGLTLQYIPEVSGDRQTWLSDGANVLQVSVTSLDAEFDLVTVRDQTPTTAAAPRFIRLRVVEN
jgi:YD repeat-containing protein